MSLFAERWLRHVDRLPVDLRKREKIFDWVAIACAIIGSLGLIFCSIVSRRFDSADRSLTRSTTPTFTGRWHSFSSSSWLFQASSSRPRS
jgi:hypothetical protein